MTIITITIIIIAVVVKLCAESVKRMNEREKQNEDIYLMRNT